MNEPTQQVLTIKEIKEKILSVPDYQRPYKWKSENVVQLLEDIFEHVFEKKKVYRIGNLIIHEKDNKQYIIDGQQRLITLSILFKFLGEEKSLLLTQDFKHKLSKDNIVYNAREIGKWLKSKIGNEEKLTDFKTKILEKCEFVLFTVFNQDEAFQLFDSQNARGKSLEPYDLLKAFHLREMRFETEENKAFCAERWEKSIENRTLKPILGNHLFRIRKWCKNEDKYDFKKEDIDEFKGVSLYQKQRYPYESLMRMLDGFVENAQNDKFLKNSQLAQSYPFSITMAIINGKRFFEYVDYYISLRGTIFNPNEKDDFNKFYAIYCLGSEENRDKEKYHGAWRVGDAKVRNLYENILLMFVDKFGYAEFPNFYKAFYKAIYKIRCNNKSIRFETILYSQEIKILQETNDYANTEKLKKYQFKNYKTKEDDELVKGIKVIKKFIDND